MKQYLFIILLALSFSLNAQETATLDTTTQTELRCEITKEWRKGFKKEESFYNADNVLMKLITYRIDGRIGYTSVYTYHENGKKKSHIKYDLNNELISKTYFRSEGGLKSQITYTSIYNSTTKKDDTIINRARFFHPKSEPKFTVHFKKGVLSSVNIYSTKGVQIKDVIFNTSGEKVLESYYYFGRPHGWNVVYENGVKRETKENFYYKGTGNVKAEDYPEWKKDIKEFAKIPAMEEELQQLLKKHELL